MIGIVIASACLMMDGKATAKPTSDEIATYQTARASAGRSADAHVKLALWCEAHGMTRERLEHLAMAITADPANATARGLMGVVQDGKRWRHPEEIVDRDRQDAQRVAIQNEYADRRAAAKNTADSQWDLALWCEQHGLADEARAHLATVVRLDPGRSVAWKRLGCKKIDGRWVNQEQIDARKAEIEAQKAADRIWLARFSKIKADLRKAATHDEARFALADVRDPRCVPALMKVFATNDPQDLAVMVQVLGQTDGIAASRALAYAAMNADDAEIRRTASETLRRRDPREFGNDLIAAIRPQVKYEVRPVGGPGSPGVLLVEGQQFDRRRFYAPPQAPVVIANAMDQWTVDEQGLPVLLRYTGDFVIRTEQMADVRANLARESGGAGNAPVLPGTDPAIRQFNDLFAGLASQHMRPKLFEKRHDQRVGSGSGAYGAPVGPEALSESNGGKYLETRTAQYEAIAVGQMEREARRAALVAQQQLEADVAAIEAYNRSALIISERATSVLRAVSGEDFGENQDAWSRWLADTRGYAMATPSRPAKPLIDEVVPISYAPAPLPTQIVQGEKYQVLVHSCFAAGTLVRTRDGDRPIETLAAGDVALVQDPSTGAMSFQPIVAVYHNPPNSTFQITMGDETVVATGIHRFWKAGIGWTMARDLRPGDRVRTVAGTATVSRVEPGPVQPVFNLEVAKGRSFFVGKLGALVHDNSLVETVSHPFDAVPSLASTKTPQQASSR